MSLKNVSPLAKIWYKWKTLPLPWRRQVLAGIDLKGNTFWELRDPRAAELGRARRMVKTPRRSTHYADVAVSPAWHQWLRHARPEPPSVDEQRAELARQQRIKYLAAQADARWKAEGPSVLDGPEMAQAVPALRTPRRGDASKVPGTLAEDVRESMKSGGRVDEASGSGEKESWGVSQQADGEAVRAGKAPEADPWKQADTGVPGQNWQPQGWNPSGLDKRRE